MKKTLFILGLAFMLNNLLGAQDLLVFINGDEIPGKVLEVGSQEIKIKKWDNLDGPTYTYKKTDIFMIKYENGEKHIISTHKNILLQNDYDHYMARSNKNKRRGSVLIPLGVCMMVAGVAMVYHGEVSKQPIFDGYQLIGLGTLLTAGSIPMLIVGPISYSRASKYKRMALEAKKGMSISISPVFNPIVSGKSNSLMYQGGFSINVTF